MMSPEECYTTCLMIFHKCKRIQTISVMIIGQGYHKALEKAYRFSLTSLLSCDFIIFNFIFLVICSFLYSEFLPNKCFFH